MARRFARHATQHRRGLLQAVSLGRRELEGVEMTGFQAPKDSRDYFRNLLKRSDSGGARLDTLFDQYYLCLMVGLDRRVLGRDDDLESDRFIERYPTDYQSQADVIAGL